MSATLAPLLRDIEHDLIARETMNVDDANATLAQWTRGVPDERGGN